MPPDRKSKLCPSPIDNREVVNQGVIKALGNPVRAKALAILNERIASPNEIAQELGQSVGHVSYHVNVLKKCECIELVDTASRRGAVEHFYRATIRLLIDDEAWAACRRRSVPASPRLCCRTSSRTPARRSAPAPSTPVRTTISPGRR